MFAIGTALWESVPPTLKYTPTLTATITNDIVIKKFILILIDNLVKLSMNPNS